MPLTKSQKQANREYMRKVYASQSPNPPEVSSGEIGAAAAQFCGGLAGLGGLWLLLTGQPLIGIGLILIGGFSSLSAKR